MRTYPVTLTSYTTAWHPAEARKNSTHSLWNSGSKYVAHLHWNCFIAHVKKIHLSTSKPGCWYPPDTQDIAGSTHRQIHTRTRHKSLESVTPASQGRLKLSQAHSKQVYSKWPATPAEHCSKHAWNGWRKASGSEKYLTSIYRSRREYSFASQSLIQSPQRATQWCWQFWGIQGVCKELPWIRSREPEKSRIWLLWNLHGSTNYGKAKSHILHFTIHSTSWYLRNEYKNITITNHKI